MAEVFPALRDRVRAPFTRAATEPARHPHGGLLLDRGLVSQGGSRGTGQTQVRDNVALLDAVAALRPAPLYAAAYARWRAALSARPHTAYREAIAPAGLIVGLGNESVLDTAITLHHIYGVPYIPGSALKGLARHHARTLASRGGDELTRLGSAGDYAAVLFGSTDDASYCTFHDAWYIPGSAPDDRPLQRDVITVHHPKYYTQAPRRPPWDFDDPNPVAYLSARGGFLLAVGGPDRAWALFALDLLIAALRDGGAGGKTSSGYGRLIADRPEEQEAPLAQDAAAAPQSAPPPASYARVAAIDALAPGKIKPEIRNHYTAWATIVDVAEKTAVGEALLRKAEASGDKGWLRDKAATWMAEVRAYLAAPPER